VFQCYCSANNYTGEVENRPKSAHRYNVAEQQLIYKSEIERIWKAQFDSLSRKTEPQLTAEEAKPKKPVLPPPLPHKKDLAVSPPPAMSPLSGGPLDAPSPAFSRGSSLDRGNGPDSASKVLRIKRLVRQPDFA
jgi:transcription initiation factor TFIID subunit 1